MESIDVNLQGLFTAMAIAFIACDIVWYAMDHRYYHEHFVAKIAHYEIWRKRIIGMGALFVIMGIAYFVTLLAQYLLPGNIYMVFCLSTGALIFSQDKFLI